MAEQARTWAILEATAVRLREISTDDGYRTNIGADVRTEPTRLDELKAPRVTLYAGACIKPDDARSAGERKFDVVVEVAVPTAYAAAQETVVNASEDIEQALNQYLQQPMALPLDFEESLFLERPEGMAVMVAQLMFGTRFRR